MFAMTDKPGNSKNSLLTSLPLFLRYSNASLSDETFPYERVAFKMKEGTNTND
jgi:hypothetical protein